MQRQKAGENPPRKVGTEKDYEREDRFQRDPKPRRGASGTARAPDASASTSRPKAPRARTASPKGGTRRPARRAS
jgi:hypothetical protein